MVNAVVYTKYIKKKQEYRFHVFDDNVIDVQRKARNLDVADEDVDWRIRNLEGGFIFAREGVELDDFPPTVIANVVSAVECMGLTFGSVDVAYNERNDEYFILEVNSASGLEGTTVQRYADAIEEFYGVSA